MAKIKSEPPQEVNVKQLLFILLQNKKMSQSELAEKMGTTRHNLNTITHPDNNITLSKLQDIINGAGEKMILVLSDGKQFILNQNK